MIAPKMRYRELLGAAELFYQAKINTGDLMKKVFRQYVRMTWEMNPSQCPSNNGTYRFVLGKPDSATLVEFWIDNEYEKKFTTTTYDWLDTLLEIQDAPHEDDLSHDMFDVPSFVGPAILLRDKAKAVATWKEMTAVGYERFL